MTFNAFLFLRYYIYSRFVKGLVCLYYKIISLRGPLFLTPDGSFRHVFLHPNIKKSHPIVDHE